MIEDPNVDVLIEGPTHKVMVFFAKVDSWPAPLVVLLELGVCLLCGLLWWLTSGEPSVGLLVGGTLFLFTVFDTAVFISLPPREISFGPWKSQAIVLLTARTVVTLLLGLTAVFSTPIPLGLFLLAQATGVIALVWGAIIEPFQLKLTELTIRTDRLPADSAPIRLLHISDLHVERVTLREAAVLHHFKQAKPDLVVITGDYVNLSYNRDPKTHRQVRKLLSQFSAPYGVYATLGSPPVDLREEVVPLFEGLDIELMRHQWRQVDLGNGRCLTLLGMDVTHHLPTDRTRFAQLIAHLPSDAPTIFLYHSPELMPEAAAAELDLYLCGHTHGGQVRLPLLGPILTSSQLGRRYVMGLYKEGRTHLYNSRGVGLEGLSAPRVRFLAPPEMTLVTLLPTE